MPVIAIAVIQNTLRLSVVRPLFVSNVRSRPVSGRSRHQVETLVVLAFRVGSVLSLSCSESIEAEFFKNT